jgi:pimeloyl-ACP methyl ester carboxylesterase
MLMSAIVIDNQMVHYEVLGRGRPVLFLHGWLGSWRYWFPTMEAAAEQFRTYSFDFWGFGDSRNTTTEESIRNYSDQVIRFLDELGIDRVYLVGHSMGGMVAMQTALDYPERVVRLATVGAPFDGRSLSWLLKLQYWSLPVYVFAHLPWLRRSMFRFFMGQSDDPSVQEILNETVKSDSATLQATVRSMMHTDLRPELMRLKVPALIVHGGRDEVVHPNQARLFDDISLAQPLVMPRSRHFPFFDEQDAFHDYLLSFLKEPEPTVQPSPNGSPYPAKSKEHAMLL